MMHGRPDNEDNDRGNQVGNHLDGEAAGHDHPGRCRGDAESVQHPNLEVMRQRRIMGAARRPLSDTFSQATRS